MLHRCRGHAISHGIGKPLEALGTALADPGDGRGDQLHAEQVGHQRGQTLLGQQLVVQQIEHEGADPRAVLHRRSHPIGKCRPGPCAAGRTTAAVRTVFGDDQRLWIGKVEYLPGDVVGHHRLRQRFTARGTSRRIVVDDGIGRLGPAQRRARVALLPAQRLV
jgi:hypothetical protein